MPSSISTLSSLFLLSVCMLSCNASQSTDCADPESKDCPTSPAFGGGAGVSAIKITGVTPLAAKPLESVSVVGEGFSMSRLYQVRIPLADGSSKDVPMTVSDRGKASFVMPEGAGLGLRAVTLVEDSTAVRGTFSLIANQFDNQLPIWIGDESEICTSRSYIDINGATKTGSKDCTGASGVPECSSDGMTGCLAVAAYPAALASSAAAKILSGQTLAGVSGNVTLPAVGKVLTGTAFGVGGTGSTGTLTIPAASDVRATAPAYGDSAAPTTPTLPDQGAWDLTTSFPGAGYYAGISNAPAASTYTGTILGTAGTASFESHSNCAADGATGCVTTSSFKSANMTNVTAGNIKSGVTIAGVTGQYPSATYTLPSSSGADLTTATFNAQIKSSATFQYFDSAGARYTAAGDANITPGNIANGVSIFGTSGTYTGAAPNAWDLRVGVSVGGVTGKLKVNCRNRINSTLQNYDGSIGLIGTSGNTGGATLLDIWDTIDDYNNNIAGIPTSIVTSWGSNTDCGGVEASAGDDNVWRDVTTNSGGSPSTCTADSARCTMQDKITGLWWSKLQSTGAAWNTAWSTCVGLNYNGQTGWRLPTQKELMDGYNHGFRSAESTNWITEAAILDTSAYFWSGSTVSNVTSQAFVVFMASGYTFNSVKSDATRRVVCVR